MTHSISTDQDCVALFRRAVVQCDWSAREVVQQRFGEVVLDWLRRHPSREAACRLGNEEQYVAQALAQFWQMSAQQQVEFQTLADVLQYLRVSLNGVVLDTLRASARPGETPLEEPGDAGELGTEAAVENESGEAWEMLRRVLPSRREQRLAYLLFHCGLKPREIVRCCPGEFSDVQDIYTLRCSVMERLLSAINDQGEASYRVRI